MCAYRFCLGFAAGIAIAAPASAAESGPGSCRASPVGDPIASVSRPLAFSEVAGRPEEPGLGRRPQIGELVYDQGVRVSTSDPRLAGFRRLLGPLATAQNACGDWIAWDVVSSRPINFVNFRVVAAPNAPAATRPAENAAELPPIFGYQAIAATRAYYHGYKYVGLWRSEADPKETLIAIVPDQPGASARVLAKAPLALSVISALPDPHAVGLFIDLASSSAPGEPIDLLRLDWFEHR